ncbi:acyl-CoA Delta-9 desaturase-like [Onthophagus taurus]|uniref:acyl-CoA Delta-9 desaturase-like n=1 Tax=Onthophagus taurus TaxID=166361 RepID=UPI000C2027D7|nr:acyl-CoA Delta(11) desaturase-like [Onthophagus taurus]
MLSHKTENKSQYKWDIVWLNVIGIAYLHLVAIYGLYATLFHASWKTNLHAFYVALIGSLGITAGCHRYWCHKSYKAKLPLRLILLYFNSSFFQNCIYVWVRDHRVHHKFSETDADPHNSARGLFFSHMGWLMVKKHPDVLEKGKSVPMDDLKNDPIVMFQKKYYFVLMPMFCFILPTLIPWYFWNEDLKTAFYVTMFRYCYTINLTWCLNSFCHTIGYRPYDKNMKAVQNNLLGPLTIGEGWHNYHHVFPWDYKASEYMGYGWNLSTGFIDLMAKIGWAYDLKSVSKEMIEKRMLRTGDGSLAINGKKQIGAETKCYESYLWGWDDVDMIPEEKKDTTRLFQHN